MARTNSNSELEPLDVGHELPPREETANDNREQTQETSVAEQGAFSEGQLNKLKKERDALMDRMARTQAEFENARKRAAKAQQEFQDFALEDALKSLLPVLDSFDWALQTPTQDLQEFRSGVELIRKQLHDVLGKLGMTTVPAKGEQFDPRFHEAVETTSTTSTKENHVMEELQPGYKLKNRLLRPAMVLVARNPANKD
jgi:molecular chaperone GrpE